MTTPAAPPSPAARRPSPAVLVFLALTIVTALPYASAALDPPPGTRFLGVFFQVEDIHNYLGYVQQASEGRFLFNNKLVLDRHQAALVNVEWWLTGVLSRAVGGGHALAFRIVGVAATLALVVGVDRLLGFAGLPGTHRAAALAWVFTAGGLGGLRFLAQGLPPWRSLDLVAGLFPFIEVLINPHFVVGTALLVWTLLAWEDVPGTGGRRAAWLYGCALALSRPYDAALALAIAGLATAATVPPRRWPAAIAPLLPMLAPMAYQAWVLYRIPAFAVFSAVGYEFPPLADMAVALGPAAAAAVAAGAALPREARLRARVPLAWAAIGIALVVLHPLPITLQFLAGVGVPLVAVGALGTARWPPAATAAAALTFASTPAVALHIVLADNPRWMVPAPTLDTALGLRGVCAADDVVMAPPDLGLLALAHSPCRPFVAHVASRDYAARDAAARRFYTTDAPAARMALLDAHCVSHVVLPGDPGEDAAAWLGGGAGFRRTLHVPGGRGISVYSRPRPEGCR
jgi:hypothetical protein